jgi:hypothetical protein
MTREKDKTTGWLHDREGHVVVWQRPNPPLIGWAIFFGVSFMTGDNYLASSLRHISFVLLLTWAIMEIATGASGIRKTAGLFVLLGVITNYFKPKKLSVVSK